MKLIYCASPGKLADKKEEIMDFVAQQGCAPFHPFQAFEYQRFEGGPVGRGKTMQFCCKAIDICDEFWLFGISEGTLTELNYVLNNQSNKQKKVKLFLNEFHKDWQEDYRKIKDKFNNPLDKI